MGATFIITLREAFEAALLLGIVYTYLDRVGSREHFGWVTLGALWGWWPAAWPASPSACCPALCSTSVPTW